MVILNEPTIEELARVPPIDSTQQKDPFDRIIYERFFFVGSGWYVAEWSPGRRLFFGYVISNNEKKSATWDYFSLDELSEMQVPGICVARDAIWKPTAVENIERIVEAYREQGSSVPGDKHKGGEYKKPS